MNRKLKMGLKRLRHLPRGMDFLKYSSNKLLSIRNKLTKTAVVAHPSVIMLEVTNICNLHCLTCPREYSYGQNMDTGFMDLQKLKRVVDEAYPYIDAIGLTGLGEPLLYKDLIPAVDYIKAKSKGIIITLSTNANVANAPGIVEKLVDKVSTIQISIDGIEDVYEKIRINGKYKLFLDNASKIIELTKHSNTSVMFNTVITKDNYRQMSDLVRLADELKIDCLNFTLFNLASCTDIDVEYYDSFYTDEFIHELKNAEEIARNYPNLEFSSWDYLSTNEFKKCPFPWNYFYITWDGYLVPCCAKPFPKEMNFGNVFQSFLMECLNSEGYQNFRRSWIKNKAPKFCSKCHFTELKPLLDARNSG